MHILKMHNLMSSDIWTHHETVTTIKITDKSVTTKRVLRPYCDPSFPLCPVLGKHNLLPALETTLHFLGFYTSGIVWTLFCLALRVAYAFFVFSIYLVIF